MKNNDYFSLSASKDGFGIDDKRFRIYASDTGSVHVTFPGIWKNNVREVFKEFVAANALKQTKDTGRYDSERNYEKQIGKKSVHIKLSTYINSLPQDASFMRYDSNW